MSSQGFAKFLLWLNAAVWLGFGVGYAIAPDWFATLVGADVGRADSYRVMTDVGVMMVGIAGWYAFCALDDARTDHGLISALLICAGLVAGRLIAIAATGSANSVTVIYLVLEVLDLALLALAVRARSAVRGVEVPVG
jgi:hypothetical protein